MDELTKNVISYILGLFSFKIIDYLILRYNYHHLFAETVSKSRMDWIDNFREELSTFIGYTVALCCMRRKMSKAYKVSNRRWPSNGVKDFDLLAEAEKARVKLRTRLNMDISREGNEYNKKLDDCLRCIDLTNNFCMGRKRCQHLVELSRLILEPEWQRVKMEAKGDEK